MEQNVIVHSKFHIKKVLKQCFKKYVPRLFSGSSQNNMAFHQHSASLSTTQILFNFFLDEDIIYITPEEWRPMFQDAASMDLSSSGILKQRLHKNKVTSLAGLKRVLKLVWHQLIQSAINKAIISWPRHCSMIHYAP